MREAIQIELLEDQVTPPRTRQLLRLTYPLDAYFSRLK
jgi:hypothetical protein